MLQRYLLRLQAAGWLVLLLLLGTLSLRADDAAGEATFDRNAPREWTDVSGVKVTGRFSGVIRDEVLININGRVQRVKLSNLSEGDIAWLWGLHNQEGTLDQLPVEYRERPVAGDADPMPDERMPSDPGNPVTTVDQTASAASTLMPLSEEVFDQQTERVWTVYGHYMRGRLSGMMETTVLLNVGGQVQRVDLFGLSDRDLGWCWEVYFRSGKVDDLPGPYDRWSANPFRPATSAEAATSPDELYANTYFQFWINGEEASIHAAYSGISASAVTVTDRTGANHSIALDDLSLDEVAWIRGYHAHHGTADQLPERLRLHDDPLLANAPGATAPGGGDLPEGMSADDYFNAETYRDWTAGDEPVYGGFDGFFRDEVQVTTLEGRQSIPLDELSQDDVAWLRGYHAHHGLDDQLPDRLHPRSPNQPAPASVANLRDTRTWTDRDGRTTQGSFSSVRGEEVSLFAGHGVGWIDVHLAQLSRADLIWLQDALRNEGRLRELPLVYRDAPDERTSDGDLVRTRRQGGLRQWKLYNNQTFVAAYDYVAEGVVYLEDNQQMAREEHWNDLSADDHEYLKERLGLETPAEFFPAQRDLTLSTADQTGGMRIWTDREGNQIVGTFKNLAASNTVAVFHTAEGEKRYIYEYISNDDQAFIQGVHERQQQQVAQGGQGGTGAGRGSYASTPPGMTTPGYNSSTPGSSFNNPGIASPMPGYQDPFNPGGGTGQSSGQGPGNGPSVPTYEFHEPYTPPVPDLTVPTIEWVYTCSNCGAEFDSSSGLKQGDPCPRCSGKRFNLPWWAYGCLILVPLVIRKMSR